MPVCYGFAFLCSCPLHEKSVSWVPTPPSPWMVERGIRQTDLSSTCAMDCGLQVNCKATSENKVFVVTNPGHLGAVCYCSKG